MRIIFFILLLLASEGLNAQSRSNVLNPTADPRGEAELRICSQNMENYGPFSLAKPRVPSLTPELHSAKELAVLQRFVKAKCDVIATQEILGKTELESKKVLDEIASNLHKATGRFFETRTGPSNDPIIRLGFIVAKDRAEILNLTSYYRVELPKTTEEQRPRNFPRGPLEIQLQVKPRGESFPKVVTIVTFHFKSKYGGAKDPAQLEWETFRMEMAEAIRRIIETRHSKSFGSGDSILVLAGDRNSNFDAASAKILDGTIALRSFQGKAPCRLSKRGVPLCQKGASYPQRLFSVLTTDPATGKLQGTFKYGKTFSWLDEILLPTESLPFALENPNVEGDYASGVVYDPKEASDHAMVWVDLNW